MYQYCDRVNFILFVLLLLPFHLQFLLPLTNLHSSGISLYYHRKIEVIYLVAIYEVFI